MAPFAPRTRLLAAAAIAMALAACGEGKAPAAAPLPVMDAAALLPNAPPAPVNRYEPDEGYRWAERAYGVQRAIYDTPPDYGFSYGDEEPLAWETSGDWSVYAEPWDDGYRYYYYGPGGDYPYFVRDDAYGYGYDRSGALVVVLDAAGRYLPVEDFRRVAPRAGRYYAHGRDLRRAGLNAQRTRVAERAWTAQAPRVSRSAERWLNAARTDGDWRRWREDDRGRELDRFAAERLRRAEGRRARRDEQTRTAERRDLDRSHRKPAGTQAAQDRGSARHAEQRRRGAEKAQQERPRAAQQQARAAEQAARHAAARENPPRPAQAAGPPRAVAHGKAHGAGKPDDNGKPGSEGRRGSEGKRGGEGHGKKD